MAEGLDFEGREMTGWRIGEAERVRMRKGGFVSVDDEGRWTANAVAYGRRGRRPTREKKESKMGGCVAPAERMRKKKTGFMSKERARARLAYVFWVRNGLFRTGSYHNVLL